MSKKLVSVLLLTTMMFVTACGKGTENDADVPAGSPSVESPSDSTQSAGAEAEGSAGETSQPAEEAEAASYSYIFSDMPVAAYEVTGLGVGRFESVHNETVISEDGTDYGIIPFVRLTPGENTFILFCMLGDQNENMSVATIRSSSESGQWEAITYSCLDGPISPMPEGFSPLTRKETDNYVYDERTYGGSFDSWNEWYPEYIRFAEIYHPDAPQEDAIYVVNVVRFLDFEDFDEMDEILAGIIETFDYLGATINEIPVEEALERSNIAVSEGGC